MKVKKRDGKLVDFDLQKIKVAIAKAFASLNKTYDDSILDLLSLRVTAEFQDRIKDDQIQVEEIQDAVEKVLSVSGYADVAKAYILYRRQRENVRKLNTSELNYKNIVDTYLNEPDSDQTDDTSSLYSVGGLILSNSAAITRNYWLSAVFDQQIVRAQQNGDIYIHDLDMLTGDSAGWSLKTLIEHGLGGVEKKISCRPPKHLFSICNQLVNFLGIMQNEWAGAQSISGFDTYLAPFVKADQLDQAAVDQCIETFIYGVNMPSRWGTQSPFSCIGFDWDVPEALKEEPVWIGGKKGDFCYGDCTQEMRMIQNAFFRIMASADQSGHGFPFPIPTVTIGPDFDWDDPSGRWLFQAAGTYGTPYFMNGRLQDAGKRSFAAWGEDQLMKKTGGYYGYQAGSGSIGMVTINLPRIAYRSEDENDFFRQLEEWLQVSIRCLDFKRQVLEKLMQGGLYPYTARYIENFDHHFGTIGIVGMNEACQFAGWVNESLLEPKGQAFGLKVLRFMNTHLIQAQQKNHHFYNLEATPGEHVSYWFVEKDQEYYPEMNDEGRKCYTNSTDLPVNATEDVFEALDIEQKFQPLYSGGSAFHIYLNKAIKDWKHCRNLVRQVIDHFEIVNFTVSPSYSVCPEHGYLPGVQAVCPECGAKTEIWARVAGYYQPVEDWNEGKKQEFIQRKNFVV